MAIPISNVTRRVVYAASGTGPYAFTFEILANTDIAVYRDDTLLTLTTNYTVTINSNGTGSITLTAAPTGATQIAIVGNRTIQRTTDFVTGGDFFANTVNDEMDQQTIFAQQNAEGLTRSLQAPQTDPTTIDMTLPRASVRANKTLAFDANGDPTTGEVIGDNRGNWASGVAYNKRDIVKDTSTGNVYYCNTSHTSSGSQPITTNADSAKWDLFVDNESAEAAQTAAEAAQAAAEAAQTAAETAETNAETAETNAETAATNAASSASAASTSASNASSSASSASSSASAASASASNASTQASNASTSASNASTSASNASTSASNAASSASTASTQASNASTSATNAASSASAASTSASNAATSASNASASETAAAASAASAAASFDAFDDIYLGAKSSDPALDNDGNALTTGDQYFNTTANELRVYNGSTWQAASTVGGTVTSLNVAGVASFADGSASTPSITNDGDTNTGIFFPAADTIGVSEGGVSIGNMNTWYRGLFRKTDPTIVAWTKTGAGTATTSSILYIEVNGALKTIASGTSISMPTLASGTDYAIWAKTDGTLQATTDHTSPPTANARKVGGFHYAHGGNATGTSGGDTTPAINEYSMWDLKWRPTAPDPRGMTLIGGGYWADIYLTGVDAITNGSSKYNVTMADGSSPPKVPTMFGGNGSTTYGTYTWFEAMELATAFGKRCPTQAEFMSLAYGTTEASSIGSDQGSTILNAAYTSKWGVMQAAGVLWVWGRDRGGAYNTSGWNANTEGRGSEYNAPNSARFGGTWSAGADSGSRCSDWSPSAAFSTSSTGSRFVCDHLQLD